MSDDWTTVLCKTEDCKIANLMGSVLSDLFIYEGSPSISATSINNFFSPLYFTLHVSTLTIILCTSIRMCIIMIVKPCSVDLPTSTTFLKTPGWHFWPRGVLLKTPLVFCLRSNKALKKPSWHPEWENTELVSSRWENIKRNVEPWGALPGPIMLPKKVWTGGWTDL